MFASVVPQKVIEKDGIDKFGRQFRMFFGNAGKQAFFDHFCDVNRCATDFDFIFRAIRDQNVCEKKGKYEIWFEKVLQNGRNLLESRISMSVRLYSKAPK